MAISFAPVAFVGGLDVNLAVAMGAVYAFGFLLPFLAYLLFTRQGLKQVLPWKGLSLKNALLVVLFTFALMPMVNLVWHLSSFIFVPIVDQAMMELISATPMIVTLILIGVFPAIFEEILFRGALCSEYRAGGVSIHKGCVPKILLCAS